MIRVAEVDKIDRPGWEDLVSRFDDATIYQTWAYGAAHWGEGRVSHLVLKTAEGAVGIAQVTVMRIPIIGAGIAYVPWGPLWRRKGEATDTGNFGDMVARLRAEYAVKRGLLLRIAPNVAPEGSDRFEAILGNEGYARTSIPGYRTLVLDLTRSVDAIRKSLDSKWRNQLNRSEKNGLSVLEGTGNGLYERFAGVYREMIGRKKFRSSVDIDVFSEVQRNLPEAQKMRIFICEFQGMAVAATVGTSIGDTGIYLFGATSNHGKELKGSYLLQWRMIGWMKEQGCHLCDLGGNPPGRKSGRLPFQERDFECGGTPHTPTRGERELFRPGSCAGEKSAGISCGTSGQRMSGDPDDMMEIAARYRSSPTFVRYSAIEDAEPIRKEWDDFIEKETGDVFLTYDWCRVWWRHYGNRREPLIYVFRDGGEICGILPMFRERIRLGPVSTTVVKLMCSDSSPVTVPFPVRRDV